MCSTPTPGTPPPDPSKVACCYARGVFMSACCKALRREAISEIARRASAPREDSKTYDALGVRGV
eukprot:6188834-Amphidinium_carterae.1